jgi:hypothetical protein
MANLYYRVPVVAQTSVTVQHNFDLPQVEINALDSSGEQINDLITSASPLPADPRNQTVVNFSVAFTGEIVVKNDKFYGVYTVPASSGGGGGNGSLGPIAFSRSGNTSNGTFLRVDGVQCKLPNGSDAAAGYPVKSDGTLIIAGLRFRSVLSTNASAVLELFRCEGDGATGTQTSLLTETIPAGVFEHDVALNVSIPSGDWTIVAQRTSGGSGNSNKWEDCVALFLIG